MPGGRSRTAVFTVSLTTLCSALWAAPTVFWHSDPIGPDESVLVIGSDLGPAPQVELIRLDDGAVETPDAEADLVGAWVRVEPLQPTDGSLKLIIPADMPDGIVGYRITVGQAAATGLLNRPVAWWVQGDLGPAASPGGWLRLLGKNLASAGDGAVHPSVYLKGPEQLPLPAQATCYQSRAQIPADLAPGEYEVYAHSGRGGAAGWSEPLKLTIRERPEWPTAVYSVLDYGADGSGARDSTEPIRAALKAAEAAGGGIVQLPRGRYQISGDLAIPRFTLLRGEARELTALFWPDTETPPEALVHGTNSFGLEDVTLYASRHQHVIAADLGQAPDAGNVFVRRVRVRADAYRGHLEPADVDKRLKEALKLSTGGGDTIRMGGENIEITDCDLYGSGRALFLSRVRGGVVSGNSLYNGRWGWYCISGSDGLVFERNTVTGADLMSTGGGLNCLDGSNCSQSVYYANNTLSLMHGWDREAMTSDAGGGAYFGAVESAEGQEVTLAGDPEDGRNWAGGGLFILDGRGRGQYRRIVSMQGRDVTVESPWAVAPDATSTVSVTMLQRHYIFDHNSFSDAGVALQLYGMAVEHIADGNTSIRTGGYHNFGMRYHGIQPSWYIQWLGNEIAEGNVYRSGHDNYMLSGEAHLGIFALPPGPDFAGTLTLGCIARRNRLLNNATLVVGGTDPYNPAYEKPCVQEVIVEGNHVANADVGIALRRAASGVLLRANSFENVRTEIWDEAAVREAELARQRKLLASPKPLAIWRLAQMQGMRVPDASGNGFDASLVGSAELVEGPNGAAAKMGPQSYLRVEEPSMFNLQSFSLSAWICPDNIQGRHGLIGKRFSGTAAPFVFSLWDGRLEFEATDSEGKWSFNFRSEPVVKQGEWAHVAAVAEQGKGVRLHVNGAVVAEKQNAGDKCGNGEPLIIGREAWSGLQSDHSGCWFEGLLDEVKIWGRALTDDEVKTEADR